MTRTCTFIMLAAAAALAGCEPEAVVVGPGGEIVNQSAETSAPVELPPSISASKIYRCADNDVVYVDYLSDGKSANIRTEPNGPATHVTATEAGQPMTAEGYSLSGSPGASTATIAVPGQSAESCKA